MAEFWPDHEANLDRLEERLEQTWNSYVLYRSDTEFWRNKMRTQIQDYLQHYDTNFTQFIEERFRLLIKIVTDDSHPIEGSQLTIRVLQAFLRLARHRGDFYKWFPPGDSLRVVLEHAHELEFDFWGVRRGTGEIAEHFNPVVECCSSDDRCLNACLLLHYGFPYICTQAIYLKKCWDFQDRMYGHFAFFNPGRVNRMMSFHNKLEMMLTVDTFTAFSARDRYVRRNKITSLVRIFRSIPQPYVTPDELQSRITSITTRGTEQFVVEVAREYSGIRNDPNNPHFDQTDSTKQPRPVRHLCRCKIREVLTARLKLPDGIENIVTMPQIERLGLSAELRSYLSLEN